MALLRSLFLNPRFFVLLASLSGLFILSHWVPVLYAPAWVLVIGLGGAVFLDLLLLYLPGGKALLATRGMARKLSNGDPNPIRLRVRSRYPFSVRLDILDELPEQFQARDFGLHPTLAAQSSWDGTYSVLPVDRGIYRFGYLNVFVRSPLGLIRRRFRFEGEHEVPVYPSIIHMQQHDFLAFDNRLDAMGLKKIRKIGHTQEFEQIKEYIVGDDIRTLNWKATAKKAQLMVNQYQDERSQPVYSVIDTSRAMKMPFERLKLLDYAINSTLAFANVALKRNDRYGLLTFSDRLEGFLPATGKITHLNAILEKLYKVDTRFLDADYGLLYAQIKRNIPQRSLLFLFTNFEHPTALKRQLPYLKAIARKHLLVVVFFENTELDALMESPAADLQGVYHKTMAHKFALDKRLMEKELRKHGIQVLLVPPKELTISAINKYLEIKARSLL